MTSTPFFLFIGTSDEPAVTTKLKATETDYRRKMLESRPENWQRIIEILRDPDLAGVLVKLTAKTCELLTNSDYADLTPELVQAIATVPNIVFIHEAVLSDVVAPPDPNSENVGIDESGFDAPPVDNPLQIGIDYLHDPEEVDHSKSFKPIPEDTRDEVRRLVVKHDLNLAPYKRNAHLAMLAAQFIDNADRKLLFRIYVPAGRLWAKEADRLLGLFSDWLAKTKGQVIRQGGYKTGQGAVYEFYSDEPSLGQNLSSELYQFSDFLDLCIQDPDAAVALLYLHPDPLILQRLAALCLGTPPKREGFDST